MTLLIKQEATVNSLDSLGSDLDELALPGHLVGGVVVHVFTQGDLAVQAGGDR